MTGPEIRLTVRRAGTLAARLKGLMFEPSIDPDTGLWLRPCRAVHTFFMRFPIDLIFLDRNRKVLKLRSHVRPNRPGVFCAGADSVLECRAGFIERHRVTSNHILEFSPEKSPAANPVEAWFKLSESA